MRQLLRPVAFLVAVAALYVSVWSSPVEAQTDPVLFELQDKSYRIGDLPVKLRKLLAQQEARHYRERRDLFDQLVFDALLASQSRESGRSRADLSRELLAISQPTEEDAKKFYEANKARITQDFAAVKERIMQSLRIDRINEKKRSIVAKLQNGELLKLSFSAPLPPPIDIPVAGYPQLGPADAPFKVVEFADFSCPLCKQASEVMHNLHRDFPTQLQWTFLHFPVGKKGVAAKIHEGGHCLIEQDLFWPYHDLIFARMTTVGSADAPKIAREVGADMERFEQCYSGRAGKWAVKRSLQLGRKLGVTRTPTLFLNGRPFGSTRLEHDLRQLIEGQENK